MQISKITDAEYRQLPAWNNSSFQDLYCHIRGLPIKPKPKKALYFGSCFHQAILEPDFFFPQDLQLTASELRRLDKMIAATHSSIFDTVFQDQNTVKEIVCQWTDPDTLLPCKGKYDLVTATGAGIIDLKTTSERSVEGFMKHFTEYGYDTQAAFYLDGLQQANRFVFVCVSKVSYEVFPMTVRRGDETYETGRRKYKKLLKEAAKEGFYTAQEFYQAAGIAQQ